MPRSNSNKITPINTISTNKLSTTPSMMNTLKEGFSFGVGSAIAHNTINSLFSSKPVSNNCEFLKKEINNTTSPELIEKLKNEYIKCLEK